MREKELVLLVVNFASTSSSFASCQGLDQDPHNQVVLSLKWQHGATWSQGLGSDVLDGPLKCKLAKFL